MKRLDNVMLINNAMEAFNKVFRNNDPFNDVLNSTVSSKILVFRTEGYFLAESQFNALKEAIKEYKESEIYISITEHEVGDFKNSNHWIVESDVTYDEYTQMPIYLENAIYSSSGKWGIIISHEEHAVVGGGRDFIERFKSQYTNYFTDVKEFKLYWENCKKEYSSDIGWLEAFLEYFEK